MHDQSDTPRGHILLGEPIQGAPRTVVVEHACVISSPGTCSTGVCSTACGIRGRCRVLNPRPWSPIAPWLSRHAHFDGLPLRSSIHPATITTGSRRPVWFSTSHDTGWPLRFSPSLPGQLFFRQPFCGMQAETCCCGHTTPGGEVTFFASDYAPHFSRSACEAPEPHQ
jgi:hypothetical protein